MALEAAAKELDGQQRPNTWTDFLKVTLGHRACMKGRRFLSREAASCGGQKLLQS